MAPACSFCQRITSRKFQDARDVPMPYIDHQPSIAHLLESGQTCLMCKLLVSLFDGTKAIAEMVQFSQSGHETKIRIVIQPEGDRDNVLNNPVKIVIYVQGDYETYYYWMSEAFVLSTDKTAKCYDRPVWSSKKPITFNERATMIKEWMHQCDQHHSKCSAGLSGKAGLSGVASAAFTSTPPTRLIYVGGGDSSLQPRLVLSENLDQPVKEYTALSHCWGLEMPLTLTRDNLKMLLEGIDEALLPKTFIDAIYVNRKVGISFLWIDSLCIIQDDPSDWERESSQMVSIYMNAHLTLAAASAKNCHEGLYLGPVKEALHFDAMHPEIEGERCEAQVRFPYGRKYFTDDVVLKSPLYMRGWVLQEIVLSKRVVFFCRDQLYWQCTSCHLSEDDTVEVDTVDTEMNADSLFNRNLKRHRLDDLTTASETWCTWILEFQTRLLTKLSDKLPALAGLTNYYHDSTGDEPLVGLWRRNIFSQLLWRYEKYSMDDPKDYKRRHDIPSWSWASIDAPPSRLTPGMTVDSLEDSAVGESYEGVPFPQLISSDIAWSGPPLSSSILRARLLVRGHVVPRVVQRWQLVPTEEHRVSHPATENYIHLEMNHKFDLVEPTDGSEFLCFHVPTGYHAYSMFLILELVENKQDEYRRVGIAFGNRLNPNSLLIAKERILYLL